VVLVISYRNSTTKERVNNLIPDHVSFVGIHQKRIFYCFVCCV